MKKIQSFSIPIIILIFITVINNLQFEKIVTLTSGIILTCFLIFNKDLNRDVSRFEKKVNKISKKIPNTFFILILFFLTLIVQNKYLNFETITWDVASYLVASSEIDLGFIPLETQWESKGPVLMYIYFFIDLISEGNLVIFKILNDVILFFISTFIFLIVLKTTNGDKIKGFASGLLFITFTSKVWYVSGFSEIYCLLFLSLSIYLFVVSKNNQKICFLIGILISLSSLVNLASALFLIPFLMSYFQSKSINYPTKKIYSMILGFILPHIIVVLVYLNNGILDIHFANYVTMPLGYTSDESLSSLYELRVWLREMFYFNNFLYFSLFSLLIFYITSNYKELKKTVLDFYVLSIFISLAIYFIGSHNYYHHLFYFIFFVPFLISKILNKKYIYLLISLIFIASINSFTYSYKDSFSNLQSLDSTLNEYPLYQLSQEIDSYFDNDYSVFALDYVMVLHYLKKQNFSYIVHPMNHFADFITIPLTELGKISDDNVQRLLDQSPDVIICNTSMIIDGIEERIDGEYICELESFGMDYFQLNTDEFRENSNLFYFKDPVRVLNVFIKK